MKTFLRLLFDRHSLSRMQAEEAMDFLMKGEASEVEIAAFLGALRAKTESVDELVGFARSLRKHAKPIEVSRKDLVDTCGTGGDDSGSFNISTAAALLIAASGLGVVKHGNRAVSSRCGSADVLEALGLDIERPRELVAEDVESLGFGFLYAPSFHPAMRFVAPVRRALGIRTVFNILGPMANPANAKNQVIGVYDSELLEKVANTLKELGSEQVVVVAANDGMDEISNLGPTKVAQLKASQVSCYTIAPEELGIERAKVEDLAGGDADYNAKIIEDILTGKEKGARRDIVLMNAAAALVVSSKASDLHEGIDQAKEVIVAGAAGELLAKLRERHGKKA